MLLIVFVINIIGYPIYYTHINTTVTNNNAINVITKNYKEAELAHFVFSITSLPYNNTYTNSNTAEYITTTGEVVINGNYFNYIKKRYFKDSIEFVCLPNMKKKKLIIQKQAFDIASQGNGKANANQPNQKSIKLFQYDGLYFAKQNEVFINLTNFQLKHFANYKYLVNNKHTKLTLQPPECI